jgi:hypothetical protein
VCPVGLLSDGVEDIATATVDELFIEIQSIANRLRHRPRVVSAAALGCLDGSCALYRLAFPFTPDDPKDGSMEFHSGNDGVSPLDA